MWSLFNKKGDEFLGGFSGEKLEPLKFSNGKTQEDIVKEILKAIEDGNKVIFLRGVCGSGKCLDGETLIFCKPKESSCFSYYSIADLVGKGGRVISVNNAGNLVESEFCNVRETGIKPLYSLKTRSGRQITASQNHPFLTITEKGIEWLPLEKLDENSYICLPNHLSLETNYDLEDDKIKILAHLIAEGKLGDKSGSPKYYQEMNSAVRADYESALKNVFPDGELRSSSKFEVTIVFKNKDTRFGTTNKLRLFVREFGLDGKRSREKFIPKEIFNLNENKTSLFLRTLFSCDGTIYIKKSRLKKQLIIEYDTISKKLAYGVSLLLLRFGIQHTITNHKFRDNPEYGCRITISNQEQLRKYIEKIGFIGKKQEIALNALEKLKIHKFTNIDKVPRILRDYLKNKGFDYNQLDRYLNFEEIEKLRENIGFKRIIKDKLVDTPCVFKQGIIDFLRTHIKKINEYIHDDVLSFVCKEGIIWDKIKSIEYAKDKEAYDLEVPEHHNFIANGIIVHNSAVALNLARHFDKTAIVVPIKSLQEQYEQDYSDKKFILKKDNKKLKISVIKGRANFRCQFSGERADDKFIPCTIEIKEKNFEQIKNFIDLNKEVSKYDFTTISDVRRLSVAPACPYWSPLMPADMKAKSMQSSKKHCYKTVSGKDYCLYEREKGCKYFEQYLSYSDADVLIFNSAKYLIESAIGRKPKTDLDIIDECDEFLDSFAEERTINLGRLSFAISSLFPENQEARNALKKIVKKVNDLMFDYSQESIEKVNDTEILELIELVLDNPDLAEDDEDNYYNKVFEISKDFEHLLDEVYVSFKKDKEEKEKENAYITLVTINLASRLRELVNQNEVLVLMSGTLHSEQVLKDIFGLDKFKIIEAETQTPGHIVRRKTNQEVNCKYTNFKQGLVSRQDYLEALSACVSKAKPPILVHVNSFEDLPSELEKAQYHLDNILTRERLLEIQGRDRNNSQIGRFKSKEIDILFTTKCSRGVDFPGNQCNSVILTKYPYPNIRSLFWQILKKEKPEKFTEFYMDKARRELLQKVYRAVRFKDDYVVLLSPDSRVLNANIG
ncbi:MAG: helicase C-terminal domain-containing protein [Nanoarchaeota archaeon]